MATDALGSLAALIARAAESTPAAVAITAPDRPPLTYAGLHEQVITTARALRAAGVEVGDRVALIVENGPNAAAAFLAASTAGVCAPLNPSYRAAELEFYLEDLRARVVVVSATLDTPARAVAAGLGVDVIELQTDAGAPAGTFTLAGLASGKDHLEPGPDDDALVLHTSGTTARPKIVPLAHRHLLASAHNVARVLRLKADDRCLNVMPLFHIHGIVAALVATVDAGGSIACTPGFHQLRFFEWLRTLEPTWTTAVPTMHQAILERAVADPSLIEGHRLRFVRSSSAALPVPVLEGLEALLGVPVVEAYGMTEAAHQMASNPLPPGSRKPGSVGTAAGPEIAILDPEGNAVPQGIVGEVAIRGESVFAGYESNPDANAVAWCNGWFRTGDEGRLDADGYLVLHGRLKEIINRAGEKVSPLEVDGVLLRHPDVAQAVTFGIPDERLGEEVAAAVILRDGATLGERELQDFVSQTIAPFKVPRRIVLVEEIPKGPTGKLQRVGLAERLELTQPSGRDRAKHGSSLLEEEIAQIWSDVLAIPGVGPLDDFFALGGDSILGAEAVARVRDLVGRPELPLVCIVRSPTPRALALELEDELEWGGRGLITVQAGGDSRPIFLAHAVDGDVIRYAALARRLGRERPIYGMRAPGIAPGEDLPEDIEALASLYLEGIRAAQPHGPYLLGGFCMGAVVTLELTRRLESLGETVERMILVDPRIRRPNNLRFTLWLVSRRAREGKLVGAILRRFRLIPDIPSGDSISSELTARLHIIREEYICRPTTVPVALVLSADYDKFEFPDWYLRGIFERIVSSERVSGLHDDQLFKVPAIDGVAAAFRRALDGVDAA